MEGKEIIDLYWQRSETAILETAAKYRGYCYQIAFHILSGREDAEECVNDTWLGAWQSIPPYRPENLSAFLGRITRSLAFNKVRARCSAKRGGGQLTLVLEELAEVLPDTNDVEDELAGKELEATINRFLKGLSERDCNLFLRRYWYVESIEEIAVAYKMKPATVKTSLHRSRKKLKLFLEKEGYWV